jgi:acetyl-CoA carboxylase biotin carboxyl carrier protein
MYTLSEIKELMKLLDRSSIQTLSIQNERGSIRIEKAPPSDAVRGHAAPAVAPAQSPSAVPIAATDAAAVPIAPTPSLAPSEPVGTWIVSPMVGTFYAAPSPDAQPFVKVGDAVTPTSIVCIIEAMKLMNEIESEVSGSIAEVLVTNGQLVEYGQPLFRVVPS